MALMVYCSLKIPVLKWGFSDWLHIRIFWRLFKKYHMGYATEMLRNLHLKKSSLQLDANGGHSIHPRMASPP